MKPNPFLVFSFQVLNARLNQNKVEFSAHQRMVKTRLVAFPKMFRKIQGVKNNQKNCP